jgi:hypothetical protein
MATELDVLRIISERLEARALSFMLTGSFALAYYATPRMTRDLDIVVALQEKDISPLVASLAPDFYVDAEAARDAVRTQRLFNLLHLDSGIKVDLIVRKTTAYRRLEFERRIAVQVGDVHTWIATREDLILSKLVWARDAGSELQLRDVRSLLEEGPDVAYLRRWAAELGVATQLEDALR